MKWKNGISKGAPERFQSHPPSNILHQVYRKSRWSIHKRRLSFEAAFAHPDRANTGYTPKMYYILSLIISNMWLVSFFTLVVRCSDCNGLVVICFVAILVLFVLSMDIKMALIKLPSKWTNAYIIEIPVTYGKPHIFLTITCNPNWQEIQDGLFPGQTPQDQSDLVAQVFRSKMEMMKLMLTKKYILGDLKADVYVVEFQKRGLSHAHFMLM